MSDIFDAEQRREYLYSKYDNEALDAVRAAVADDMLATVAQLDRADETWARGVVDWAFGQVYRREVLDPKTRALVAVAMNLVLGNDRATASHMQGALKHGASVEEIREVCFHSVIYNGFPKSHRALETLERVLATSEDTAPDAGGSD